VRGGLFTTISAAAGLVAFVGDYVIPFVLGHWVPGYSHLRHVQSELGTVESSVRRWINAWWILFGGFCVWFGVGYAAAFGGHGAPASAATSLIVLFGLGAGVGGGLFPQEPGGTETTAGGKLHGIFAGTGEIAIIVVPLLNLWVFSPVTSPLLWWASLAGFVPTATTFGMFLGGKRARPDGVLSYVGFWQRAYFLFLYLYLGLIAVEMIRA